MANAIQIPGIPRPFEWLVESPRWELNDQAGVTLFSGPDCDHFHDPASDRRVANAPCALAAFGDDPFLFSVRASVEETAPFDAAALFVRISDEIWAKLCVEFTPQGRPMIVSVVTRGLSDDCNSVELDSPVAYLRVIRRPQSLAFHHSLDGSRWHFVRHFSLGSPQEIRVGIMVQAPRGPGCVATFSEFRHATNVPTDLRDGQ